MSLALTEPSYAHACAHTHTYPTSFSRKEKEIGDREEPWRAETADGGIPPERKVPGRQGGRKESGDTEVGWAKAAQRIHISDFIFMKYSVSASQSSHGWQRLLFLGISLCIGILGPHVPVPLLFHHPHLVFLVVLLALGLCALLPSNSPSASPVVFLSICPPSHFYAYLSLCHCHPTQG